MGLETGDFISDLVSTNPTGTDQKLQGDDHIRLVKHVLKTTFPNLDDAVTATPEILNALAAIFPLTDDYFIRANGTAALELRSPAQVRSDVGADNATNLTSGSLADARLSSNVPLKNAAASITAVYTFSGGGGSAPSILVDSANVGMYAPGSTSLYFNVGGANAMRLLQNQVNLAICNNTGSDDRSRLSFYSPSFAAERGFIGFNSNGSEVMRVRPLLGDLELRSQANAARVVIDDTTGVSITPVSGPAAEVGFRKVVRQTTGGTLTAAMVGTCQAVSAGVTVPDDVFAAGDAVQIYNNSASSITITQGSGVTLRLGGTATTGNRTLAARGIAYLWWNAVDECIAMGAVT